MNPKGRTGKAASRALGRLASRSLRFDLLTFAGHLIVPVHECTVGVVPPRPTVQLEKRRYAV